MSTCPIKFRESFKVAKEVINWYPGHMRNSFEQMQAKMRVVDCIVEVHDSRIPFSGRNPLFMKKLLGTKPHILVLNKLDLTDASFCKSIKLKYKELQQDNVIFVNALNQRCRGLKKIIPLALKLIKESSRSQFKDEDKFKIMVVGVPNVGKSSLINALRNTILSRGKAAPVGAIAGITKSVQNEIKVSSDPLMYLIDTPGILLPTISDTECGMKLALCSCLKDDLVGIVLIADFLLYWMNKTSNFKYVELLNLKEPIDDIVPLLKSLAISFNKTKKVKNIINNSLYIIPDINFAAHYVVKLYRKGKFGDLCLDESYL